MLRPLARLHARMATGRTNVGTCSSSVSCSARRASTARFASSRPGSPVRAGWTGPRADAVVSGWPAASSPSSRRPLAWPVSCPRSWPACRIVPTSPAAHSSGEIMGSPVRAGELGGGRAQAGCQGLQCLTQAGGVHDPCPEAVDGHAGGLQLLGQGHLGDRGTPCVRVGHVDLHAARGPPSAVIRAAVWCARSQISSRPTAAPHRAKARAVSRPMPCPAPVTMATLPSNLSGRVVLRPRMSSVMATCAEPAGGAAPPGRGCPASSVASSRSRRRPSPPGTASPARSVPAAAGGSPAGSPPDRPAPG